MRRIVSLRKGWPKPGDKVKVLGGNVLVGNEGRVLENGAIDFGSFTRHMDPIRLVVIELGPEPIHPPRTTLSPQPITKTTRRVPAIAKVRQVTQPSQDNFKENQKPEPDEQTCVKERESTKMEKKGRERRRRGADWGFD